MNSTSYDNSAALVLLPAMGIDRLQDRRLRAWVAQSDVSQARLAGNLLATTLEELGRTPPATGLAALRLWGQTGDRPTRWMAAAEPVYLEPRLEHLCLHTVDMDTVTPAELRGLTDHLQGMLGDDGIYGFGRVGPCCYVSSTSSFATADVPASAIDGYVPNDFLPQGEGAALQRRLQSEIEMALYEHPVNIDRMARHLAPINSFWLWGGGRAPERIAEAHPPLFSDDPLLGGYWESRTGVVEPWPGTIARCFDIAVSDFVAVVPRAWDRPGVLDEILRDLRAGLRSGRIDSLVLRFGDGMRASIRRSHALRFWRSDRVLQGDDANRHE